MDVEVSQSAPVGWNELVAADPEATFFHMTEWARALCESGAGSEALYLVARDGGELAAGIPAVVVRRGPFRIVESMPLGTYGGLVVRPGASPEASETLLEAYAELAGGPDIAATHLMDETARVGSGLSGFETHLEQAHRIALDKGYDSVWEGFRPSARNKVRKARKAGVVVRRAVSETDFMEYHGMLVECSERWGEECAFGPAFFSTLSTFDREIVQMWLAEHEGKVIGGDLNFVLHGRIMNWGNVSRDSARALAPNNLLHAAAMEKGTEQGLRQYDLGSSAGIEGVDAFKSAFGTSLVPLRRYSSTKPWYRALRAAVRRAKHGGHQ